MTVVVLDGPEKAGKSTLAAALVEASTRMGTPARIRKWGALDGGKWAADSTYADALAEDSRSPNLVVWDRSWASEAVYGRLLGRDRRLAGDPWLGEWLYGRGVLHKFILAGPDPSLLLAARTHDDLPTSPTEEQAAFVDYGRQYGWTVVSQTDPLVRTDLSLLTTMIMSSVYSPWYDDVEWVPTEYCGRPKAPLVFLGDQPSRHKSIPGGWLPFSSRYTTAYGRLLGDAAVRVGWTNVSADPAPHLKYARGVVACGGTAQAWMNQYLMDTYTHEISEDTAPAVLNVPHPSALYRWGGLKTTAEEVERQIREFAASYIRL